MEGRKKDDRKNKEGVKERERERVQMDGDEWRRFG
jgi:hypothetical protein